VRNVIRGKLEMAKDRQSQEPALSGSRMSRHRVIAIDGPAASGKSSVARKLAQRLGFVYVNSGAMYRAMTWHVLQHGASPEDATGVAELAEAARVVCNLRNNEGRVLINDVDPTEHLCDDHVNQAVSFISSVPRVRKIIVEKLRNYSRDYDLVMEGRDIGSVVFPDTPYKFYIDASPEVRLQRRAAQGQRDEIATRDRADSSRAASPLVVAQDAEVIDSSHLSIEGVVGEIIARLEIKGLTVDSRS
jgi:cytidylate kinase